MKINIMLFLLSPIYMVNYINRLSIIEPSLHSWYNLQVRFSSFITLAQISRSLLHWLSLYWWSPLWSCLNYFSHSVPGIIPSSLFFSLLCMCFDFYMFQIILYLFKCLSLPLNSILTEGLECCFFLSVSWVWNLKTLNLTPKRVTRNGVCHICPLTSHRN